MTFSILDICGSGSRHKLILAGLVAAMMAGCYHAPKPATAARPPLIIDQAMQQRDWSKSVAYYQNGGVKSTSGRTVFTTGPHNSRLETAGLETGAFVGNAALMPFTLVTTPFNSPVVYHGEQLDSTFNGMPSLPPAGGDSTHVNGQPLTGSPVGVH